MFCTPYNTSCVGWFAREVLFNFAGMKINVHTSIRIISLLLTIFMLVRDLTAEDVNSVMERIFYDILAGSAILLAFSDDRGNLHSSLIAVSSAAVIMAAACLFCPFRYAVEILAVSLLLVRMVMRTVLKYRHVRNLFKTDSTWRDISDYSLMAYQSLLLMLVISRHCFQEGILTSAIFSCLMACLYVILYRRAYTGHTCLIPAKKERLVKEIMRGNLGVCAEDGGAEGVMMNTLYRKVVGYMDSHQPFLNDKFGINDLAEAMYTNRAYLSRAINTYSGRNFRQFVNWYRIKYSVDLIDSDLRLKVVELASMSGFHSVVTYNMAFKLNMNKTPSEYINDRKASRLECPSNSPEPER